METINKKKTYDVDVIKMIRNNNIVTKRLDDMRSEEVYFMLDYFDLLFHKSLMGEDKVYRKFWDIEGEVFEENLAYKAAYKTLSLYDESGCNKVNVWDREHDKFSPMPFLGIVQINIVYHVYNNELKVEEILKYLETEITKEICFEDNLELNLKYRMYRSSTSSDFTLVIKSNRIEDIFKVSILINNMVISYEESGFNFKTYTNIGIECVWNEKGEFLSFPKEIVEMNPKCKFALRFTTSSDFANRKYKNIVEDKECYLMEHMDGLFGRYDFLVHLSMKEFAQIYPVLCRSKTWGNCNERQDGEIGSLVELLQQGIVSGDIHIINERALVPLDNITIGKNSIHSEDVEKKEELRKNEEVLKAVVKKVNKELGEKIGEFQNLRGMFIEERRAFIDVTRELKEVINTYVPQGLDHDSHVNWQILISDLRVLFKCIEEWNEFYNSLEDKESRKNEREHFLGDLRLVTEAINQYYKFLQNVNSQTWQSPLYEIQTQLDAEKMMIAYREFLYEYFCKYKQLYADRPMFYPLIYPDISASAVCVSAPFKCYGNVLGNILICEVPSFEYYGRIFDMVPWTLHEASHSLRTMDRKIRNEYLIKRIFHSVFEQVMREVLNKYSNDFGYHKLGNLERDILKIIEEKVFGVYKKFYDIKIDEQDLYFVQTEVVRFLSYYFDLKFSLMENGKIQYDGKAILSEICKYFAELNMLDASNIEKIGSYLENEFKMEEMWKIIYDAYFRKIWNCEPKEDQWKVLRFEVELFEKKLKEQIKQVCSVGHADENQIRFFCFKMREINRLYFTWDRRGKERKAVERKNELWEGCIGDIRARVEKGIGNHEGFTEIYRIMNMIFGSGEAIAKADVERVGAVFNNLSIDYIAALAEREVSIYRETCADLYMVATLGLNAFGYCRQMFQTVSDISVENNMRWEDGINVHRFRVVIAVLLSCKGEERMKTQESGILIDELCEEGKRYCCSTLKCLKNKLLSGCSEDNTMKEKEELVNEFVDLLEFNVEVLFESLVLGEVRDALEKSVLFMFARKDAVIAENSPVIKAEMERIKKKYEPLEKNLDEYRHVLYRIQYFIYALAVVAKKKVIYVDKDELEHMKQLFQEYTNRQETVKDNSCYSVVAEFYNDPQTAENMSNGIMLDDTIRFVEEYYYRNRFKIMSSMEIKEEVRKVEEEQYA